MSMPQEMISIYVYALKRGLKVRYENGIVYMTCPNEILHINVELMLEVPSE